MSETSKQERPTREQYNKAVDQYELGDLRSEYYDRLAEIGRMVIQHGQRVQLRDYIRNAREVRVEVLKDLEIMSQFEDADEMEERTHYMRVYD